MLQFIIGVMVGGVIGFVICALFKNDSFNDFTSDSAAKKTGEENDDSE